MTEERAAAGSVPPIDELRRRVYRPGASAGDVARYEAALAEVRARAAVAVPAAASRAPDDAADAADAGAVLPGADASGADSSEANGAEADSSEADGSAAAASEAVGSRRPRRVLIIAAATALALIAVVAVARTVSPAPAPAAPVASPAALRVDDATRAAFVLALTKGGSAGIGAYLATQPGGRPAASATATRSDVVERTGNGSRTLQLPVPSRSGGAGGRATVLLVLAADAKAGWAASRFAIDEHRTVYLRRVTARGGSQRAGVPSSATFSYRSGERPVELRVTAPAGVRWGVAVVFTG